MRKNHIRRSFIFLFFIFYTTTLSGQSETVSRLEELMITQKGNQKCATLLDIANAYGLNEIILYKEYSEKALKLAKRLNSKEFLSESYFNLGQIYLTEGNLDRSDSLLKLAEDNFTKPLNYKLAIRVYNRLATVALKKAKFESCKSYIELGKQLSIKKNDDSSLGSLYIIEASLAQLNLDTELMEMLMHSARKCFKRSGFNTGLVATDVNLASIAQMNGKFQKAIDLYDEALLNTKEDSDPLVEATCLINKGRAQFQLYQIEQAKESLDQGEAIARTNKMAQLIIDSYLLRIDLYIHESKYKLALKEVEKGIETTSVEEFPTLYVQFLSRKGNLHFKIGELNKAFHNYFQALSISDSLKFEIGIEDSYSNIAEVYLLSGDHKKAKFYLNKSFAIAKHFGVPHREGIVIARIGDFFVSQKKWESAKVKYNFAIKKMKRAMLHVQVTRIEIKLAYAHLKLNDYKAAKALLAKVEPNQLQNDSKPSYYWAQGELSIYEKKFREGRNYLLKAVKAALLESNHELLLDAYSSLRKLEERSANYQSALNYFHQKVALTDSLFNLAKLRQIALIEIDFETRKKENDIKILNQNREIQELNLEKQERELNSTRKWIVIIVISGILIILIGFLFFIRLRLKQKDERHTSVLKEIALKQENRETASQLEISKLRINYFTDISHELRTPLTLIIGPLEQLMKNVSRDQAERYQNILDNAKRLMVLVNESLKVRLLETGKHSVYFKEINVREAVERNIALFSSQAIDRQISIHYVNALEHEKIVLDEDKLDLILINLIGNVFNHNNRNDEIHIVSEIESGLLSISITDNGKGIPDEHLPFVFDRFYKVSAERKNSSGIGLALTKELVELHRGEISVKQNIGPGVTFIVRLPIDLEISEPSKETNTISEASVNSESFQASEEKKILIIEDNLKVQEFVGEILYPNYQLIFAQDGREGIEKTKKLQPDLIISDVMMPELGGIELCALLKKEFSTSHIPIILLTAKSSDQDLFAGLEAGADDYLTKPFSPKELKIRIKNLIEQRTRLRKSFSNNVFLKPEEITSNSLDQEFLSEATKIVESNLLSSEFNVELFCSALKLNRNSVHQKLKSLTDLSASQFINSIKLKKAAVLLHDERLSIIEVSELSGFNSRPVFNKTFKNQFKITPSEYREKCLSDGLESF